MPGTRRGPGRTASVARPGARRRRRRRRGVVARSRCGEVVRRARGHGARRHRARAGDAGRGRGRGRAGACSGPPTRRPPAIRPPCDRPRRPLPPRRGEGAAAAGARTRPRRSGDAPGAGHRAGPTPGRRRGRGGRHGRPADRVGGRGGRSGEPGRHRSGRGDCRRRGLGARRRPSTPGGRDPAPTRGAGRGPAPARRPRRVGRPEPTFSPASPGSIGLFGGAGRDRRRLAGCIRSGRRSGPRRGGGAGHRHGARRAGPAPRERRGGHRPDAAPVGAGTGGRGPRPAPGRRVGPSARPFPHAGHGRPARPPAVRRRRRERRVARRRRLRPRASGPGRRHLVGRPLLHGRLDRGRRVGAGHGGGHRTGPSRGGSGRRRVPSMPNRSSTAARTAADDRPDRCRRRRPRRRTGGRPPSGARGRGAPA